MSNRIAVVLFNLGGPDSLEAVRPFLFNLFRDPAILRIPGPLRWLLARIIVARRAPVAREIYAKLGGASPILAETEAQGKALSEILADERFRVFTCMRYWHPMTREVVAEVGRFAPDRIVLLPLYPQFSSSTTASSFDAWDREATRAGLDVATTRICCYPGERGFIAGLARLVGEGIETASAAGPPRVLFSAHGVPEKFIAGGDPYQSQIENTVAAVVEQLGDRIGDYVVCYQSRVGRLKWIEPYTDAEIKRAGGDGVPVVVVPVAFVSEHSETLVELDIEYAELAEISGVPAYVRVATVGTAPEFIAGLAALIRRGVDAEPGVISDRGERSCRAAFGDCVFAGNGAS